MVLVEGTVIADVVVVEKEKPLSELLHEYAEWSPVDLEDSYLSPGLIDFNVLLLS